MNIITAFVSFAFSSFIFSRHTLLPC